MNRLNIGVMGALVSNENLGCVALTYSLIKMLERISKKLDVLFYYKVFEFEYDKEKYRVVCDSLNVETQRLTYVPVGFCYLENWKLMIKSTKTNLRMINEIRNCDIVIDLTQGDSFTDIYGAERFYRLTVVKEITEFLKIPLVLGPQTYGPFEDGKIKRRAGKVIERATRVISRDSKSKEYLKGFVNCKIEVTTDLAFALPFARSKDFTEKIKVGINPSGLLFSNKTEKTKLMTPLKTEYDVYIKEIIKRISDITNCEVHLIPHVGNDAVDMFREYPNVICHSKFASPIDAKNLISSMDVFIGSRMHATIAAFSSGVATIPVAYSRKFIGLFENLGYSHVVDLCHLNTDEAIKQTINLLNNQKVLRNERKICMEKVSAYNEDTETIFEEEIRKIIMKERKGR